MGEAGRKNNWKWEKWKCGNVEMLKSGNVEKWKCSREAGKDTMDDRCLTEDGTG